MGTQKLPDSLLFCFLSRFIGAFPCHLSNIYSISLVYIVYYNKNDILKKDIKITSYHASFWPLFFLHTSSFRHSEHISILYPICWYSAIPDTVKWDAICLCPCRLIDNFMILQFNQVSFSILFSPIITTSWIFGEVTYMVFFYAFA